MRMECHICQFVTKSKASLKSHYAKLHEELIHVCGKGGCPYFSSNTADITEHMKHEHDIGHGDNQVEFECDECGLKYADKITLNRHKSTTHNRKFKCDLCIFTTFSQPGLNTHRIVMHTDLAEKAKKKVFKCEECMFGSFDKSALVTHFQIRHGKLVKVCITCAHVAENEIELNEHLAKEHGIEKKESYSHKRNLQDFIPPPQLLRKVQSPHGMQQFVTYRSHLQHGV